MLVQLVELLRLTTSFVPSHFLPFINYCDTVILCVGIVADEG